MYKEYYHLTFDPFSTHPNTGTFFISNTHKEAWYYLLFGIETQEPFLVLTGEYGMGKTLLCLRLIRHLKETGMQRVEYIPTANEGFGGILRRMAAALEICPVPEDEGILQDMIYDRFRAETNRSRFYLIIDDAHELDKEILIKLKYISTFNHNEFFPVIMIFVAHPSFLQDLKTPALSSLNQRIKRRYHLAKFSPDDTRNYIYFRLLKAGATGIPIFPDDTIAKIFEYSGGVPRLINNICDTCLLIGASKQLISIPPSVVDEAKVLVEGSLPQVIQRESPTPSVPKRTPEEEVVFSEELPTGTAGQSFSVITPASDVQEYETETATQPQQAPGTRRFRFWLAVGIVSLFLLLALVFVFQSLLIDRDFSSLITPFSKTEKAPETIPPEAVSPVPPEKAAMSIPTLREEEATAPPRPESMSPDTRQEPFPPPAKDFSAKPGEGAESRPAGRMEGGAKGNIESPGSYPFSIRHASYQQREQALKELAEIRQRGWQPGYLVKVDLGDLGIFWRIYIGFYATEEEARKTLAGYQLPNASIQRTEYACLTGEFSSATDSLTLFERLKQAGYYPYLVQKERSRFRLYLGAYEKRSEAEAFLRELQPKGIQAQVVKR